jgi:hypothetical protein
MTEREAEEFFIDVAMVAFPQARKFILMNSSDPVATVRLQSKSLLRLEMSEAASVVDRWLSGTLPSPTDAEMGALGLAIRQVVLKDRGTNSTSKPLADIQQDMKRENGVVPMSPYLARILALGDQHKNNEITYGECRNRMDEILAAFDDECNKANKVRA